MKKIFGLHTPLVTLTSLFLVACSVTENTNVTDNSSVSHQAVEINHQHTHPKMSNVDEINQTQQNAEIANENNLMHSTAQIDIKSFEPKLSVNPTSNHYRPIAPIKKKQRRTVLSKAERFAGVLESHNIVRRKHGLQSLTWSDKLARYSKQWSDHLGSGSHCQIRHRGGTPPYGENLYRASALRWSNGEREILPVTIKNVVKAWTDEEKWYDYNRNRCQPGKQCGHYTQVVWRDTTEVGCSLKICADKSQTWVCSYNPPGNFQGVKPY